MGLEAVTGAADPAVVVGFGCIAGLWSLKSHHVLDVGLEHGQTVEVRTI